MSDVLSTFLGPALALAVNAATLAVGYGMLRSRVTTNEREIALLREKQDGVATKGDILRIESRLDAVMNAILRREA